MTATPEIGLIGLGTMGANLALNIAEAGHPIAVFNRTAGRTREFVDAAGDLAGRIVPSDTLERLVASLARPRRIVLVVPAGDPVEGQIAALRPLLEGGDMLIDGGNSDWQDTARRAADLEGAGLRYLGLGVSGGAEGARHGPSMMAGGTPEAYESVAPILNDIAATFGRTPCVAWLGTGGAGHFVKTVHNGIEYADMQMIAEVYGLMRDGQGKTDAEIARRFGAWATGPLESYLVEITAEVAGTIDPETGRPILSLIVDRAGQKGTGRWTVMDAQRRAAPLPAVEAAVTARVLSGEVAWRRAGAALFPDPDAAEKVEGVSDADFEQALLAGKILAYSQGFALLSKAASEEGWDMPMDTVARIWRAGCIIRSRLLDDMAVALAEGGREGLLAFAPGFVDQLQGSVPALRRVVAAATLAGLPVPALSAALAHFDQLRQKRGTANLIQGLRDRFGAHGFERLDRPDETGLHGPGGAA